METPHRQVSRQGQEDLGPLPEPIEIWTGPYAPKIPPVKIEKTWRNDTDPNRRRATFGVPYPFLEIAIEKSADLHTKLPSRFETTKRRSIQGIRFRLSVPGLIFSDADFRECKFHRPKEDAESSVVGTAFKKCTFERCMLGGTIYRHVEFEGCMFLRCDFGTSQFIDCQFLDCSFTQCTAENATFATTEIDPAAVLRGMQPPLYNYTEPIPDGEATMAQVALDWIEVRRKLAAQLLRSNTEIHHTGHADCGLFELKRAELRARFETLRSRPLNEGMSRLLIRAVQLIGAWVVVGLTRGGTSLLRLLLAALLVVPLYAVGLSNSHVMFLNQDCHIDSFESWLVLEQLARATSLFLGIGYTAFMGGPLGTVLLTVAASLGLFWYALVAAVVIRRVYR